MVKRTGTNRRKTRGIQSKNIRAKGKINVNSYFQEFKPGEKALLSLESGVQNGLYFRRFHGKIADIVRKTGQCYELKVMDGKEKTIVVHPVHLKKIKIPKPVSKTGGI